MTRLKVLLIVVTLVLFHRSADANCPYTPSNTVQADMEMIASLSFPSNLRVFNLFWSDHWNDIPEHKRTATQQGFQKEDINRATKRLIESSHFDRLCQYDAPRMTWEGGTDGNQTPMPCDSNPTHPLTVMAIDGFLACEDAFYPLTNIPRANGSPAYLLAGPGSLHCNACGIAIGQPSCFNETGCMSTPNPSGDLLINVFIPANEQLEGWKECPKSHAFHLQMPSDSIGFPAVPIPGTQSRPIYYTVIRLECLHGTDTVDQVLREVSHELAEAATDPFPAAFWADESQNDPIDYESADICNHEVDSHGDFIACEKNKPPPCPNGGSCRDDGTCGTTQPRPKVTWVDDLRQPHRADVAAYWSNNDHRCVGGDGAPTPPAPPVDFGLEVRAGADGCGIGAAAAGTEHFYALVKNAPAGSPMAFAWSLAGAFAKAVGPSDGSGFDVLVDVAPVQVTVQVTVAAVTKTASLTYLPESQQSLRAKRIRCSVLGDETFNSRVNPLWDPRRDLIARPYTNLEELRQIQAIAQRAVRFSTAALSGDLHAATPPGAASSHRMRTWWLWLIAIVAVGSIVFVVRRRHS